jgi:hypothetical protein
VSKNQSIFGIGKIVSRKFDTGTGMLLLVPLDSQKFSTPFLLYPFLKIKSLA